MYFDGEFVLPYLFESPDKIETNATYPLIIYLHGNGSQGNDNRKQMYKSFIQNLKAFGEDCFVFIPQFAINYT